MKTSFVLALTFVFSFSLFSQSPAQSSLIFIEETGSLRLYSKKKNEVIETRRNISELEGTYTNSKLNINDLKYNVGQQTKKKKSVALGVLLSALLPGAGEFYGENYLKAGIFLGVEVLAWGTYVYFTKKGDNLTDDFQNYADAHWNVRQYARWLNEEWGAGIDEQEPDKEVLRQQINSFESSHFSHTLPDYGTQQYYELIGKYQPYVAGWEDAYVNGQWLITQQNVETYKTPMFQGYAIDRQTANDQYDYAKIGPITAILNHILSAADAAWTISAYNKQVKVETGFRIDQFRSPYTYKMEMMPTFNMKVSF
ncbi:MAG TPA: hypothetical protein VGK25_00770 [Ignavibacteria bacterium]|jgi:TM2 domain-containing membrane protein YozV